MWRKIVSTLATVAFLLLLTISKDRPAFAFTTQTFGVGPASVTLGVCDNEGDIAAKGGPGVTTGVGFYCLSSIAYRLLFSSVTLIGVGLFIVLMIGGLRYITAGGDEKSIESARKTITYALTGFLISIGAFFLMFVLFTSILGLPRITFNIPDFVCTQFGNPGGIFPYCSQK